VKSTALRHAHDRAGWVSLLKYSTYSICCNFHPIAARFVVSVGAAKLVLQVLVDPVVGGWEIGQSERRAIYIPPYGLIL